MKTKFDNIILHSVFFLVTFWDILDDMLSKLPLIILAIILCFCVIKGYRFRCKKVSLVFWGYIAIHGVLNVIIGNNSLDLFIIQFGSILFCYIAYSIILANYTVERIFGMYFRYATFISAIGVIEELIGVLNLDRLTKVPGLFIYTQYDYRVLGFVKLASLCREPSFLVYLLAPAMFLVICELFGDEFLDSKIRLTKIEKTTIVVAYICTFSALAYLGILLMLILIWYKKGFSIKKIAIPLLSMLFVVTIYINVPDVRMRIDDTLFLMNNKVTDTTANLSTYALLSNTEVAISSLKHSLGLGTGLGSYPLMYDKFATMKWGGEIIGLNREDANSFILRVIAEFGFLGILLILLFIIRYIPKSNKYIGYSFSILSMLLLLGLRQGNYTHAGSVFFVLLYKKIYLESRNLKRV